MDRAEMTMRLLLDLYVLGPPDTDFEEGQLCALIMFAREGLGFAADDPSITPHLDGKSLDDICSTNFKVIKGGKS
jgi:hypothetical protein